MREVASRDPPRDTPPQGCGRSWGAHNCPGQGRAWEIAPPAPRALLPVPTHRVPIPAWHVSQAEGWLGTLPAGGAGMLEATLVPSCSPDCAPVLQTCLPDTHALRRPARASPCPAACTHLTSRTLKLCKLPPWGPSLSWPGRSLPGSSASAAPRNWRSLGCPQGPGRPPRTLPPPPTLPSGDPQGRQQTQARWRGCKNCGAGLSSKEGALRPLARLILLREEGPQRQGPRRRGGRRGGQHSDPQLAEVKSLRKGVALFPLTNELN